MLLFVDSDFLKLFMLSKDFFSFFSKGMAKFENDPFFKFSQSASTAEKRETFDDIFERSFYSVQETMNNNLTRNFDSHIQYFPANVLMIQAMYKLMKPNGVLSKEGFSYYG